VATVNLPSYTVPSTPLIEVSQTVLNSFATIYCQGTTTPSPIDFFYGYLPLASFDQVFVSSGNPSDPTLAQMLGNLYVSGYFGGQWLTGLLSPPSGPSSSGGRSLSSTDSIGALKACWENKVTKDLWKWILAVLADGGGAYLVTTCEEELKFAKSLPDHLYDGLLERISPLAYLCGYDLGFLKGMVADKPTSVTLCEYSTGKCLLDFSSSSIVTPTSLLVEWNSVITNLLNPPKGNSSWAELVKIQSDAAGQEGTGEGVWGILLATANQKTLDAGYANLFKLGVEYQLLAQTITLGEMSAWINNDAETGRLAVILEVCLVLWTGAFVLGRMSGKVDQPSISC
jgi:hypothetical protein